MSRVLLTKSPASGNTRTMAKRQSFGSRMQQTAPQWYAPASTSTGCSQVTLSAAQIESAIAYTKSRYGITSQRTIQQMFDADPDGDFGPMSAQAVARFQADQCLEKVDGKVGPETLDAFMKKSKLAEMSHNTAGFFSGQYVQLVADLFDLPVARALTVHFDDSQIDSVQTRFEAGSSIVMLGHDAFVDSESLRLAIEQGLAASESTEPGPGPRPNLLSVTREGQAIDHNERTLGDPRAIRVIQSVVGATTDGVFGRDTVERIANLQAAKGLDVSGCVDEPTLAQVHGILVEQQAFDAILRLFIDYFDLGTNGALDIRARARIDGPLNFSASGLNVSWPKGRSNSVVWVSHTSLSQFGNAAWTIAHELAHTRMALLTGVGSNDANEFEATSEELLLTRLPKSDGHFSMTASIAIGHFERMNGAERATAWPRFEALRKLVLSRSALLSDDVVAQYRAQLSP